jgi:hypothetical protein
MTQRYCFVLSRPVGASLEAFSQALLGPTAKALERFRPLALSIDVALPPDSGAALNAKREGDGAILSGLVSATLAERGDALAMMGVLDPTGKYVDGYAVSQDIPRDYERTWELGTPSPGVRQVTFLRPKPGLAQADFMEHWHGKHGPLALEIHPIWRYDRNAVLNGLTEHTPSLAGIVALHFRELADATDPKRLYGGDDANMGRIYEDVRSFLDMSTLRVMLMREHVLITEG